MPAYRADMDSSPSAPSPRPGRHRRAVAEQPLVALDLDHDRARPRRRLPAPSLSALLGVAVLVLIAAAAVHLSLRGSAVPVDAPPEKSTGAAAPAAPGKDARTEKRRSTGDAETTSATGREHPSSPGQGSASPSAGEPGPTGESGPAGQVPQGQGPSRLVVHVSGAVRTPGIVRLAPGARVADAVDAAGGATGEADLSQINLARPVADGEQIHVSRPGEQAPAGVGRSAAAERSGAGAEGATGQAGASSGGRVAPSSGLIDLNTADAQQLEELPGVGPSIAQRIIEHRETNGPFRAPEDLMEVSGIGPATFAKLQDRVTVSG